VCLCKLHSPNNKTPPLCKTRGTRGWVLKLQPSRSSASHTRRESALPFFISVHFCFFFFFPRCTFTQHHRHHHRHHQKPWSPWATFVIEALPTWRLAHSWTVLLLLRCRHNYRRIGDVVLPFWRASFLHGELHHDMQSHGQP